MGASKWMDMGPPASVRTLAPLAGGNSNSVSETPAALTVAFENHSPTDWLAATSPSARESRSITGHLVASRNTLTVRMRVSGAGGFTFYR